MSTATLTFLIIASLAIITDSRSLNNPDPLLPVLLSTVNGDDDTNPILPILSGQNQLVYFIEHIIKYVSTIKSNENFIDNIINHQKELKDKLKVLIFLNKCFQITDAIIQREMNRMLVVSNAKKKSLPPSLFTLEELQQAQDKIHDLLNIIEQRMALLKTWVPPTMPFLGF